jgi:hypothetical protein
MRVVHETGQDFGRVVSERFRVSGKYKGKHQAVTNDHTIESTAKVDWKLVVFYLPSCDKWQSKFIHGTFRLQPEPHDAGARSGESQPAGAAAVRIHPGR